MFLFGIPACLFLLLSMVLLLRGNRYAWLTTFMSVVLLGIALVYEVITPAHTASEKSVTRSNALPKLPKQDLTGGYIGAASCRECHASEHASWHHSYHRTMTQAVTTETVVAPFDDVELKSRGRTFHLWREDDQFWVEMVDPEWDLNQKKKGIKPIPADGPRVQRQIVMSTGSHHFQTYWINGTKGNQLWQVPFIYHLKLNRWIPVEDSIINPPSDYRRLADWNDACIKCHAVRGKPGLDQHEIYNSQVVDLGIACEACHGPGKEHVDLHKTLTANIEKQTIADQRIVNPNKLPHDKASHVCGQCHSLFHYDHKAYLRSEFTFRPGDDLTDSRDFYDFTDKETQSKDWLQDAYWRDGSVRVPGAEFSALKQSACFQHGELSCSSCHSQHNYEDKDDLLHPGMRADLSCLNCHEDYSKDISAHTHHAPESSGSRCYNCHIPHASFGLMKAIRSHQIDSPTASMTLDHGRPNACNLCHNDKNLRWTSEHLGSWYGQKPIKTNEFADSISTSALFLISGDAIQRAVIAWNMGRSESRDASGDDWQVPLLAQLLTDPYSVVRYVGYDSIQKFPGMRSLKYDYLGREEDREAARENAIKLWQKSRITPPHKDRTRVLINPDGELNRKKLEQLFYLRDDRKVTLPE